MEIHPIAKIFPEHTPAALEALAEDIKTNGLQNQITSFQSMVLDGWGRWLACAMADVDPGEFVQFEGDWDEAVRFVASQNLHRRHMTNHQRQMCAAKLATLAQGRPEKNPPSGGITVAEAADLMSTNERGVQRARRVLRDGVPEVADAVERGELPVRTAERLAQEPPQVQREALAGGPEGVRQVLAVRGSAPPVPLTPVQQAMRRKARADSVFLDLVRLVAELKAGTAQLASGELKFSADQRQMGVELADQFITAGGWLRTLFTSDDGLSDKALSAWLEEGK